MLKAIVIGNLGADAECRNSNGKEFVVFRVAHTEKWTDENGQKHESTTWVDCIMSGKQAVFPYLKKGTQVFCMGNQSLRVYSSAKDKCMKAGETINVTYIELLGGKSDDVPGTLYREDNQQEVKVSKWFYAQGLERDESQPEAVRLISRSNERFWVDRNGWVRPELKEDSNPTAPQQ